MIKKITIYLSLLFILLTQSLLVFSSFDLNKHEETLTQEVNSDSKVKMDFTSPSDIIYMHPNVAAIWLKNFGQISPGYFLSKSDTGYWADDLEVATWYDKFPESGSYTINTFFLDLDFKNNVESIKKQLYFKIDYWLQTMAQIAYPGYRYIFDIKNFDKYWEVKFFVNKKTFYNRSGLLDTSYLHDEENMFDLERWITIEEYIEISTTPTDMESSMELEDWKNLEANRTGIYFGAKPDNPFEGWLIARSSNFIRPNYDKLLDMGDNHYDSKGNQIESLSVENYMNNSLKNQINPMNIFSEDLQDKIEYFFSKYIIDYYYYYAGEGENCVIEDHTHFIGMNISDSYLGPENYPGIEETYPSILLSPFYTEWYYDSGDIGPDRSSFDFAYTDIYGNVLNEGDHIYGRYINVEVTESNIGRYMFIMDEPVKFRVYKNYDTLTPTPDLPPDPIDPIVPIDPPTKPPITVPDPGANVGDTFISNLFISTLIVLAVVTLAALAIAYLIITVYNNSEENEE